MANDDTSTTGDEAEDRPDPDLDPASIPEPRGDLGPILDEPPAPINWNAAAAPIAAQAPSLTPAPRLSS